MRPSEMAPVRPHLELAIQDIERVLRAVEEAERTKLEVIDHYRRLEAEAEKVKRKGKAKSPKRQGKTRRRPGDRKPATADERDAAAEREGEPISDDEWDALMFRLHGGWRQSSLDAAARLSRVGLQTEAEEIESRLSRLRSESPGVQKLSELSDFEAAEREAAEHVRAILVACLALADGHTANSEGEPERQGEKDAGNKPVVEAAGAPTDAQAVHKPMPRKRRRKRKPTAEQLKTRRDNAVRQRREEQINREYKELGFRSPGDYAQWRNADLPDGWPELTADDVRRARENVRGRRRNLNRPG
jgi:hypothetical protein